MHLPRSRGWVGRVLPFALGVLLAACPGESVQDLTATNIGSLHTFNPLTSLVGDTVALSAQVLQAGTTYSEFPSTVTGAHVQFTVADPAIARIIGPSLVTTVVNGSHASADISLEVLKEGTVQVNMSVPGAIGDNGAAVTSAATVVVARPTGIRFQRSVGSTFTDLPGTLHIPLNLTTGVSLSAEILTSAGDAIPDDRVVVTCAGNSSAVTFSVGGTNCSGTVPGGLLKPAAVGTATIHAALAPALFARFPLSTDLVVTVTAPAASLAIDAPTTLVADQSAPLGIVLLDAQGHQLPADLLAPTGGGFSYTESVAFSSSDASVLSVPYGSTTATGKAPGTATLTASLYDHENGGLAPLLMVTQPVTVTASSNVVTVTPTTVAVTVGGHKQLAGTVASATGQPISTTITWLSQNTGLATVDANGVLTGLSTGVPTTTPSATLNVLARAAGSQGVVAVTVYRQVSDVTISPAILSLHPGDQAQLTATLHDNSGNVVPLNATTIQWTTPSASAFTIDPTGRVTAVSASSDTLLARATTAEGVSGTVPVTITAVVTGPAVGLVLSPKNPTGRLGSTITFTAKLVDAQGHGVAPTSGTLGIATDLSSVAEVASSSYDPATFTLTAVVTLRGAGTTTVRGFLQVGPMSTFSDSTPVTVTQ